MRKMFSKNQLINLIEEHGVSGTKLYKHDISLPETSDTIVAITTNGSEYTNAEDLKTDIYSGVINVWYISGEEQLAQSISIFNNLLGYRIGSGDFSTIARTSNWNDTVTEL